MIASNTLAPPHTRPCYAEFHDTTRGIYVMGDRSPGKMGTFLLSSTPYLVCGWETPGSSLAPHLIGIITTHSSVAPS